MDTIHTTTLTFLLLMQLAAANAADFDEALRETLASSGIKNPLRLELQRPVDQRLLRIEEKGIEGCGLFTGNMHVVHSAAEARALSGKLSPGDQLVLAGTGWKDARFTFAGCGTAEAPILVRPEKPGSVVFSGAAEVGFHGSHLVITGLEFRNVTVTKKGTTVFHLGTGKEKPADHCIVHRIKIENCNSPDRADWPKVRMWYMSVRGPDNTVANSTFAGFQNYGQMLAAQDLPTNGLQRLHILNNRFINRPKLDDQNGYEIIQVGWSGEKAGSAGSLIQGNMFENCDGEDEIITVKASDVVVRGNTFLGCQGALSLRHADRVLVQENVFDGNGKKNTGGVRLCGADHVVLGNTFRNLKKPSNYYYWTLSMMSADVELSGQSDGYGRTMNILIARNRFERNDARIAVGIYPRPQYPLLPRNIRVIGNVFTGTTATSPFDYVAPDPTGALPQELHLSDNEFSP